ncbi:hypothetical protein [Anaeromicrobium sediminis]|uniref:Uncharacterized protein n=1 Tax=Anaeromicrobium sediminis TaxID=1478221 RepID=A0A267MJZ0_9FIRM|nr:hypothetical protein [Anaeromicrobium sediminis]PAB59846.1 hypothetical protein CCE28_07780 [Anaeromicrobium sediminis]
MGGFKIICSQCGSDKVIEKSGKNKIDRLGKRVKYAEGIERQCLDCDNESFVIHRTWCEKG